MNNYDFPIGADTKDAPWNREDPKPQKVEVTVSITLSKTVKIEVDDYTAEEKIDEDGEHYTNYDFSECDLKSAVRDQVTLPNETEFMDWDEDDFEVILE